jgi:uncharacterized membrane protein YkgB
LNFIDQLVDPLFALAERSAAPLLRISLAVVLLWIGALKFHDAGDVLGLLHASIFSALASVTFVHILGALEIIAGVLLLIGLGLRYVGLLTLALFVGTITIFFTTPAVTGIPYLTLTGQFLLKDLVLAAASISVAAADASKRSVPRPSARVHQNAA